MRLIIIISFFIPLSLAAQITKTNLNVNSNINHNHCETPSPNYAEEIMRLESLRSAIEHEKSNSRMAPKITIRVVIHRLSSSTGIEGPSVATIETAFDNYRAELEASDICLSLDGINYINNDTVMTVNNTSYLDLVEFFFYPNHGDTDRLDIFLFPAPLSIAGNAFNIPNDFFATGEERLFTITPTHEIGHCLGLKHTHEMYGLSCPSSFIENIDGSNCLTAGDLICDTPADPNLRGLTQTVIDTISCTFTATNLQDCNGDSPYAPLLNNYMSYGWSCRTQFTADQIATMRGELTSGTVGPLMSEVTPNVVTLTTNSVGGGQHHRTAAQTINTASGATITISNNAKVFHSAGTKIILGEGFEAKPVNGRYTGRVGDPCN